MARSKVELKFIEEERKRWATYRKRIAGLKKKASELAILCDVPVWVVSYGPREQAETWPEDNQAARHIIYRYRELSADVRNKNNFNLSSSLTELGHQLDSRMETVEERIQLLEGRSEHFNLGEAMNMGSQLLGIAPRDGVMGIQNTHHSAAYDLMALDQYLTMNTFLQQEPPPQPMSFGGGQISTDAFLQYPYMPIGMDEVPSVMVPSSPMNNMGEVPPLAMIPSIPMNNMDGVPFATMPSIQMNNMDGVPFATMPPSSMNNMGDQVPLGMMPSIPMYMDGVPPLATMPSSSMNNMGDQVPLAMMPSIPMNMDGVPPLATMPSSVPMNMDGVPFAMMPSIPSSSSSSMSPWVGPIMEHGATGGVVVPVDPPKYSIGGFDGHNLMGGGAALHNQANFVVAENSMYHLGDSFGIGAGPMQPGGSNKLGPFAWKPWK